jgi:hypothetical protein
VGVRVGAASPLVTPAPAASVTAAAVAAGSLAAPAVAVVSPLEGDDGGAELASRGCGVCCRFALEVQRRGASAPRRARASASSASSCRCLRAASISASPAASVADISGGSAGRCCCSLCDGVRPRLQQIAHVRRYSPWGTLPAPARGVPKEQHSGRPDTHRRTGVRRGPLRLRSRAPAGDFGKSLLRSTP